MPKALRDRFIETPNEKSIPIQNLRGQGYEGTAMDDNGSKELVDLKKKKIQYVSISLLSW